jgi:nucleoside phosphorylase
VVRTLVVSAWDPEIAPLRRMLRAAPRRWTATAVGVGPVDAAIGAARAIARWRPTRVIFVGTAGAYPGPRTTPGIGTVAVAGEMRAVSTASLRGEAYVAGPQSTRARASTGLVAQLAARMPAPPRRPSSVACPVAITQSAALARRIARDTGAALENLEAFAVARAAGAAGVEFAAVLGVSNRVGPSGHAEWRAHHAAASLAACAVVAAHLAAAPSGR